MGIPERLLVILLVVAAINLIKTNKAATGITKKLDLSESCGPAAHIDSKKTNMVVHHAIRLCICCITDVSGPSRSSNGSAQRSTTGSIVSNEAIRNAAARAPPGKR